MTNNLMNHKMINSNNIYFSVIVAFFIISAEVNATRAMVVMGLLLTLASVVMSLMFICVSFSQNRLFLWINMSLCVGSGKKNAKNGYFRLSLDKGYFM